MNTQASAPGDSPDLRDVGLVDPVVLEAEIDFVRSLLERLTAARDELVNVYVYREDDADARAFDEFYSAYDEVHAKTRSFLLE